MAEHHDQNRRAERNARRAPVPDTSKASLGNGFYGHAGSPLSAMVPADACNQINSAQSGDIVIGSGIDRRTYPFDLPSVAKLAPRTASIINELKQNGPTPTALAGNCFLSGLSFLYSMTHNVRLPLRNTIMPVTLNLLTVAKSGEGKSLALGPVLQPFIKFQTELRRRYGKQYDAYKKAHRAWKDEKGPPEEEPSEPFNPTILIQDATIEAIDKLFGRGQPYAALMLDEAGVFLGGYSMQPGQQLATISKLTGYWSGGSVSRLRATNSESTWVADPRFTIHLMIQPVLLQQMLTPDQLVGQGFLNRFLVAYPESMIGTRFVDEEGVRTSTMPAVEAWQSQTYCDLVNAWDRYEQRRDDRGVPRHLVVDRVLLGFEPEAARMMRRFHNQVEEQLQPDGIYEAICGYASRGAEHATRLAALLSLHEEPKSTRIGVNATRAAIALVQYHINEVLRLRVSARSDDEVADDKLLLEWLSNQAGKAATSREIAQCGPGRLRAGQRWRQAIERLTEAGLILETKHAHRRGTKAATAWKAVEQ